MSGRWDTRRRRFTTPILRCSRSGNRDFEISGSAILPFVIMDETPRATTGKPSRLRSSCQSTICSHPERMRSEAFNPGENNNNEIG